MNYTQIHKSAFHTIFAILITCLMAMFLCACGDNPIESANEDLKDEMSQQESEVRYSMQRQAEKALSSATSEYNTCVAYYNSTCCNTCNYYYGYYQCEFCTNACYNDYGDYICYSSSSIRSSSSYRYSSSSYYTYYSSSSSAPAQMYYLKTSKTMKFTLTYYKQVSSNWDVLDNAGDPEVSFTVYAYSDGELLKSLSTGLLLDKTDVTSWSGSSSKTLTIPAYTDEIKVCPKVVDEDPLESDVKTVSGGCVTVSNVGYLANYDVKSQYQYTSVYKIDWEWYLY